MGEKNATPKIKWHGKLWTEIELSNELQRQLRAKELTLEDFQAACRRWYYMYPENKYSKYPLEKETYSQTEIWAIHGFERGFDYPISMQEIQKEFKGEVQTEKKS